MGITKQSMLEEAEEKYENENSNECEICGEPAPAWDSLCDYHRHMADKDD